MAIKTQEFVRLSEEDEGEETVKQVQITSTSSNEIKLGIEIILQKIEAAFILLQQCIEHLQLQIDPNAIPQIDGPEGDVPSLAPPPQSSPFLLHYHPRPPWVWPCSDTS